MTCKVKICGVKDFDTLDFCIQNQVNFCGFVFHSASPRFINFEGAKHLFSRIYEWGVTSSVAVCVDPSDDDVQNIKSIGFDYIQLHGHELPCRVEEIKRNTGLQVIKAISVQSDADLALGDDYDHADIIIFDAYTNDPKMPGGKGASFDWEMLSSRVFDKKWMLSGGVTVDNVLYALDNVRNIKNFIGLDISSGVERSKGEKDKDKIINFLSIVKSHKYGE